MIVEPGPAGVLPLAEQRRCPSEIRDGPGAQGFKIIPLPLWRVSRSHPWTVQRLQGPGGRVRGTVVHSYDCEDSPRGATENLDEALTALRRPGASACKKCDAAAALTPLV
ncbi:DUF6233 domain-containing protein [Streptomyces sp. NPDC001820]|uniref:DUF6233 domain-containing protein n=1 Tax=Streptomyces sp. NPDC001820 TaxID=3364613 RepID=UPI0036A81071